MTEDESIRYSKLEYEMEVVRRENEFYYRFIHNWARYYFLMEERKVFLGNFEFEHKVFKAVDEL